MTTPATAMARCGRRDLGVYPQVVAGGAIEPGAHVRVLRSQPPSRGLRVVKAAATIAGMLALPAQPAEPRTR